MGSRRLTVELHHVIPVAWQLHTPLGTSPYPGFDPDGRGMLWDERGIWLCATGHRNTHYWIVAMMHAIAALARDDPDAAYTAVKPHRAPAELLVAQQALTRYLAESTPSGSLLALTAAGEWGQV